MRVYKDSLLLEDGTSLVRTRALRVGLDIDGVLGCFYAAVIRQAASLGMEEHFPKDCRGITYYNVSEKFLDVMDTCWDDPEFWLSIPVVKGALPMPFEPVVYITSRRIATEVTKKWLDSSGFPEAPVVSVSIPAAKLAVVQEYELDIFVDDLHTTVKQLRENGVNALLRHSSYIDHIQDECKDLPTIHSWSDIEKYI